VGLVLSTDSIDELFARYGTAYRWLAASTGLLAFFTMAFSSTIVNVAVPDVMGAFGIGQDKAQFLATAFFATMVSSQLLSRWITERLGQRLAFSAALLLFSFGSAVSGFGPTIDFIILGRVMQGFAAGSLQPLVMIILVQVFPPERRGLAMGLFSMGVVAALGVGPYIGGLTIDNLTWRYIFLTPMVTVVIAFTMGLLFLPSTRPAVRSQQFDWTGFVFLNAALFCLMTAIANGQREGWLSNEIVALFCVAAATGVGFVLSQFRPEAGLLDLSLFRNRQFVSAALIALFFGCGNFATMYAFPVFSQLVQDYTATLAGFLLLPGSLIAMAILPWTGWLSDHVPYHFPIIGGLIVFAISMVLMAGADVDTAVWSIGFFIFVGRLGLAFVVPSMNSAAIASLPAEKVSQGVGAINFFLLLGGACGINLLVVIMEQRTQWHSDLLASTQTAGNAATREMLAGVHGMLGETGVPAALHTPVALDYLGKVVHAQANTLGFQDGFSALAIVFLLAIVPATVLAWIRRGKG